MERGEWVWSPDHREVCQIVEARDLSGETTCRVWLPGRDSVVRIPASRLKSLESAGTSLPDDIAYVGTAARVANVMSGLPYTRQWHPPSLNDE